MMTEYPEEVLTKNGKEARKLVDRGKFVRYKYINVRTGTISSKTKLVLILDNGEREEFFIIPMKNSTRNLLIRDKDRGSRKLLDCGKVVDL
jgi:hypothetical protein